MWFGFFSLVACSCQSSIPDVAAKNYSEGSHESFFCSADEEKDLDILSLLLIFFLAQIWSLQGKAHGIFNKHKKTPIQLKPFRSFRISCHIDLDSSNDLNGFLDTYCMITCLLDRQRCIQSPCLAVSFFFFSLSGYRPLPWSPQLG